MAGKECELRGFYDTRGIYTYLYIIARHYNPSHPPMAPALNLKPGPISECGVSQLADTPRNKTKFLFVKL